MAGRAFAMTCKGSRFLRAKWEAPPSASGHLLASVAMLGLSIASCFTCMSIANARQTLCIFSNKGAVAIFCQDANRLPRLIPGAGLDGPHLARFACSGLPGFDFKSDIRLVAIPTWIFAVPVPLLWFLRARRRIDGSCTRCRYDFRGLPNDAPCPECGSAKDNDSPTQCPPNASELLPT
jgi:hypothetical protein